MEVHPRVGGRRVERSIYTRVGGIGGTLVPGFVCVLSDSGKFLGDVAGERHTSATEWVIYQP